MRLNFHRNYGKLQPSAGTDRTGDAVKSVKRRSLRVRGVWRSEWTAGREDKATGAVLRGERFV